LRHVMQLVTVVTLVGHFMSDDEMMLRIHRRLYVVTGPRPTKPECPLFRSKTYEKNGVRSQLFPFLEKTVI
jgi:hypothetical protein